MSLNKHELIGYVGQNPVIRSLSNGDPVAELSVATSESWTDGTTGERKESTDWHRVVVFGKGTVENFVQKYVKQGSFVYVSGPSRTRNYLDKNGDKRWVTEIVVSGPRASIQLLDRKPKAETPPEGNPAAAGDIPF